MKIRQDNRGLSLVELIIAIAVTTIIMGAVTMFLYSAQKSYKLASETIDLQIEAQLLMEQISNWVMESNDVVVETNAEVLGEILVLYDIPQNNGRAESEWVPVGYDPGESTKATKRVIWSKGGKLYMKKITGIVDASTDMDTPAGASWNVDFDADSANEEYLIGELVQELDITYDDTDAPNIVSVRLMMKRGNLSYDMQDDFKLRNGM